MEAQHRLSDVTKDYLLSISFNSYGTLVPLGAPHLQLLFALQVLAGRAWICSRVTMQASEVRDLPNLSSQPVGQWHGQGRSQVLPPQPTCFPGASTALPPR